MKNIGTYTKIYSSEFSCWVNTRHWDDCEIWKIIIPILGLFHGTIKKLVVVPISSHFNSTVDSTLLSQLKHFYLFKQCSFSWN